MMDSASVVDIDRPAVRRGTVSRSLRGGLKGGEYTWAKRLLRRDHETAALATGDRDIFVVVVETNAFRIDAIATASAGTAGLMLTVGFSQRPNRAWWTRGSR